MEGPAFSTKAESELLPQLVHGRGRHDQSQEAKLAREAEICYATVAMVTDYDCWHPDHDAVTVEQIVSYLTPERRARGRAWWRRAWQPCPKSARAKCGSALANAIITDRKLVPEETRKKLEPIVGKYFA
jgi:5'-methylthioadenosine phosphorylase